MMKSKLVLDFGCGTGVVSKSLVRKGICVVSFDTSLGMARRIAKDIDGMNLSKKNYQVVGDGEKLPFKEKCFDAVICNGVLHHIPQVMLALNEISRVIKYNGMVFISEPNAEQSLCFRFLYPIFYRFQVLCSKLKRRILGRSTLKDKIMFGSCITPQERQLSSAIVMKRMQELGFGCKISFITHLPLLYVYLPEKINYIIVRLLNLRKNKNYGDIFNICANKVR